MKTIYEVGGEKVKMQNIRLSMLWFWIAYLIVTLIGIGHTVFNIAVLHMKSMKDGPGMGDG